MNKNQETILWASFHQIEPQLVEGEEEFWNETSDYEHLDETTHIVLFRTKEIGILYREDEERLIILVLNDSYNDFGLLLDYLETVHDMELQFFSKRYQELLMKFDLEQYIDIIEQLKMELEELEEMRDSGEELTEAQIDSIDELNHWLGYSN